MSLDIDLWNGDIFLTRSSPVTLGAALFVLMTVKYSGTMLAYTC